MRQTGLALTIVLLAACGGSNPITGPDPVPGSAVRVYGLVTETLPAVGLRPVEGAVVEVAGVSAVTMADGTYNISSTSLWPGLAATFVVRRAGTLVAQREVVLALETRADFTFDAAPLSSLSGIVYEATAAGRAPLANVHVENSNNHESTQTDSEGRYRLSAIEDQQVTLYVTKAGYFVISQRTVTVHGDQTLDIELIRQAGAR